MNILITGGSGFIGLHIFELLKKKHKIFIYDLKKPIFCNNFIKGDLSNKKQIKLILKRNKINCIIHLAAFLGVKQTEKKPHKVIDTNVIKMKNLLESLEKTNVRYFVFSSSSEVYGETLGKSGAYEIDNPEPKSLYGHSKIIGEHLIKSYSKIFNFNYLIVRFFNVCGYGQNQNFVISKFIKDAKQKRKILLYGDGNQKRCFCHVKDASLALCKLLYTKPKNQTYNIGNNLEPITMLNLAKKISKKIKHKVTIKKIPFSSSDRTKNREIYNRAPNILKLIKKINFKPKYQLNKIISEFFPK
jgi:nucleoside-diphosphate-sugar epimerase